MKLELIKASTEYENQKVDMSDPADEFGFTEENAPRFTAFATNEGHRYKICLNFSNNIYFSKKMNFFENKKRKSPSNL